MKFLALALIFALPLFAQKTPSIWGKVVKTNKEIYGHEYFVTFKENGNDYAYPLAKDSKVGEKEISKMVGKYAKIYGTADFEKADAGESKYIMAFQVNKIDPLTFKELNENMPTYYQRLSTERYIGEGKVTSEMYTKRGIDDKTANTAIFIGGAALAVEVLANILKASN